MDTERGKTFYASPAEPAVEYITKARREALEAAESRLAAVTAERDEIAARLAVAREALRKIARSAEISGTWRRLAEDSRAIAQAALASPSPRADAMREVVKAAMAYRAKHANIYDRQDQEEFGDIILRLLNACDALAKLDGAA